MRWHTLSSLLSLPVLSLAAQEQAPLLPSSADSYEPSVKAARENAPQIFNAVRGAMRQWDSSLNHNGMSFFRASIPAHTTLYHGRHDKEPVKGIEWLAFEIEHAEGFAGGRFPGGGPGGPGHHRPGGGPGRKPPPSDEEKKYAERVAERRPHHHTAESREDHNTSENEGYLHTYRTKRELSKILLIDGMSAGKTDMGTLDSQDIVLRNSTDSIGPWKGGPMGEFERAEEMCDELGEAWGVQGFIRMEAGFELILCNFTENLDFISANQRPSFDKPEGFNDLRHFEFARGVAARYHGIEAGRVRVDYSSMASAFFHPLNLTNPDASRPDLPRLVSSSSEGIQALKASIGKGFETDKISTVNWEGIVDMIVTRYSDRLAYMASENTTVKEIQSEINFLLSHFIDYSNPDLSAAKATCATHYLEPVVSTTDSDHLIYEAVLRVSKHICHALFEVRDIVDQPESSALAGVLDPKAPIRKLISYLDWTTWLECGKCAYNEVCFVAIWPLGGNEEDHYHPSCLTNEQMADRNGYWGHFGPPSGFPPPSD